LFNFKTRMTCKPFTGRHLATGNSGWQGLPKAMICYVAYRFGAASVVSLLTGETHHQQIKNGDHNARDHDRVKITAVLYGFD